ncbi:acyl-CoA synthetase [Mycolicibacterium vinylchloridicum]|uniref:acyl-CoA synthetase n=1 Tax=Mycolicibacterium vinylchloridicum TaxID=2736928 RepID=UPI0015CDF44C|nr:acyl-CoA synthetase [Mycolicibacterium vinylchloridicum]
MPILRKAVGDLGENDHDLLTFDEAGGRLQNEIHRAATLVAELQQTDNTTDLDRAQARLAALQKAAQRISEYRTDGADFERLFGYSANSPDDSR